ncbi:MAG: RNA-binding transcriptional accessory protein [Duodenibacillus sp.]|nr:RNA-binding transcriptional accessory protein [Duodenibacillus sp.]
MAPEAAGRIARAIAAAVGARLPQVEAAVALLDGGATVPFIARYRKEATGGLDDGQLRALEELLAAGRALEERRAAVLASIEAQGRLDDGLRAGILAADSRQRLEDLYLPYRPKRKSRAAAARAAGLEPLADRLLADRSLAPEAEAQAYLNPAAGYADAQAALAGARDIVAERVAEDADLIAAMRKRMAESADIAAACVAEDPEGDEAQKFRDYFEHSEPLSRAPSHRALALLRGRDAGVLSLRLAMPGEEAGHPCQAMIEERLGLAGGRSRPADAWVAGCARWAWRVKCAPRLEADLIGALRERAEAEAIGVFGANLKDLLLAAPAGRKGVIGLDPGLRTGVKVAVISETGAVLETAVIHPHEPRRDWEGSLAALRRLALAHKPGLVAIGNGTASRETDRLAAELLERWPELGLAKAVVSEAGASVYSASALAAEELPGMDVSYRGAVSIARRLQDPLAELVKIDPKAIGVGQYQHDVDQAALALKLDAVVEDCVNAVGVDLNTASPALLARVSGISASVARSIVSYREARGAFAERKELLNVPRLGPRAFELAAGFLRISGGSEPLDASAVHPESYPVVERILARTGLAVKDLIGNRAVLSRLRPADFADERFGVPTVSDILRELDKPGRDPRPAFRAARFLEGVHELADLKPGMTLEGVVSNVAAFGAFVDVGVHQDGLVHVSELADRYVADPKEVVRVGQIVTVKVLEVDLRRKRIALSMRSGPGAGAPAGERGRPRPRDADLPPAGGAMAAAFAAARRR